MINTTVTAPVNKLRDAEEKCIVFIQKHLQCSYIVQGYHIYFLLVSRCELCSLLWCRTQCSGQTSWSGRAGTGWHYCHTESMKSCPWWPVTCCTEGAPSWVQLFCFHTPCTAGSCHMPSTLVVAQVRTKSSWGKEQSKSMSLIFSLLR